MSKLHIWRLAMVAFAAADSWCRDEAALLQHQISSVRVPAELRVRVDRTTKAYGATQAAPETVNAPHAFSARFPDAMLLQTQLEAFPAFVQHKVKTPWGEVAAMWFALGLVCFCSVFCCCRSFSKEAEEEGEEEDKFVFTLTHSTNADAFNITKAKEEGQRMTTIEEARRTYMERMTQWFCSEDGTINLSESCDGPTTSTTSAGSRPEIKKLNLEATRRSASPRGSPGDGPSGQRSRLSPHQVTHSPGSSVERRTRLSPRGQAETTQGTPRKSILKGSPRQTDAQSPQVTPRKSVLKASSPSFAEEQSPKGSPRQSLVEGPPRQSEARKSRVSFRPVLVSDHEDQQAS